MNNPSRLEREAVYLSRNSFISLGKRRFLGRRKASRAEERARGEQPYVDRYTINLINNPSRPERAVVYLSMNHSSHSEREDSSCGGEHLGQRKKRALGWRGNSRAEKRANRDMFIKCTVNLKRRKALRGVLPHAEEEAI